MHVTKDITNISYTGLYNSPVLKRGLKFASENGSLFSASTQLFCSTIIRPIAIFSAPNTETENKKIACSKSITSSILSFFIMAGVSLPIAKTISKIDEEPEKYLKKETIEVLKKNSSSLEKSKAYSFISQLFKLGVSAGIAVPRAIVTAACVPMIFKLFFDNNHSKMNKVDASSIVLDKPNMSKFLSNEVSFKGRGMPLRQGFWTKVISKVMDNPSVQKFAEKFKESNLSLHITSLADILATGTFIHQTNKSSMDKKKKDILVYNTLISTGLTIGATYLLEMLLKKPSSRIVSKIRQANINDPDVEKYVEGFRIAKPMVLMGAIYYCLIPLFSTHLAERAEKYSSSKQ